MEAVPRLPMLSCEMKISSANTEFGAALKAYISNFYHENPENYTKEIKELEALRQSAIRAPRDFTGCRILKRYFSQLRCLQSRFPMCENDIACVTFVWNDLYSGYEYAIDDIQYEQSCILYNIGALHSQLGAADLRTSAEGMKMACTHFQCAAWAFQSLRDTPLSTYSTLRGSDTSRDLLTCFVTLMLAQAHECILEKSLDSRKSTITAKVAAQVVDYYHSALKTLQEGSSNAEAGCILDIVGSKLFKHWKKFMEFKIAYYSSISHLYMGNQAEEQQQMGERVAWYTAALNKHNDALKIAKGLDREELNEALTFTADVIHGKCNAAKKENDFVYHEKVPAAESLAEVKGGPLVKGVPFDPSDPDICGPDIFAKLVPMEAHEASSIYSEEKAKILRNMSARIEEKQQELEAYMASLELHRDMIVPKDETLPQEIIETCAALSVNPHAIGDIKDSLKALNNVFNEVEVALKEVKKLLSLEEEREKEHQEVFGKRPPSLIITELSKEASKYEEAHKRASESNATLQKALELHLANLQLLTSPLDQLQKALPTLSLPESPERMSLIQELKMLLDKVDEMKRQRLQLEGQLRDSIQSDDITKILVARDKNQDLQNLFSEQLKKHDQIVGYLEQNMNAQDNILRALTNANAHYAVTRKTILEFKQRREMTVATLLNSYEAYQDLINKAQKGMDFYRKLHTSVVRLQARTKSVTSVQEEERQQIAQAQARKANKAYTSAIAVAPSLPSPSVPSGPKLKDFLPYMTAGRNRGTPSLPDPNLTQAPTDSAWNASTDQVLPSGTPFNTNTVSRHSQPTSSPDVNSSFNRSVPDSIPMGVRPAPVGSEQVPPISSCTPYITPVVSASSYSHTDMKPQNWSGQVGYQEQQPHASSYTYPVNSYQYYPSTEYTPTSSSFQNYGYGTMYTQGTPLSSSSYGQDASQVTASSLPNQYNQPSPVGTSSTNQYNLPSSVEASSGASSTNFSNQYNQPSAVGVSLGTGPVPSSTNISNQYSLPTMAGTSLSAASSTNQYGPGVVPSGLQYGESDTKTYAGYSAAFQSGNVGTGQYAQTYYSETSTSSLGTSNQPSDARYYSDQTKYPGYVIPTYSQNMPLTPVSQHAPVYAQSSAMMTGTVTSQKYYTDNGVSPSGSQMSYSTSNSGVPQLPADYPSYSATGNIQSSQQMPFSQFQYSASTTVTGTPVTSYGYPSQNNYCAQSSNVDYSSSNQYSYPNGMPEASSNLTYSTGNQSQYTPGHESPQQTSTVNTYGNLGIMSSYSMTQSTPASNLQSTNYYPTGQNPTQYGYPPSVTADKVEPVPPVPSGYSDNILTPTSSPIIKSPIATAQGAQDRRSSTEKEVTIQEEKSPSSPASSVSVNTRKSSLSDTKNNDILDSLVADSQQEGLRPVLQPKVLSLSDLCSAKTTEDGNRRQSKDPFLDNSVLDRFVAEVERFKKVVEGLTKKSLIGQTPLDQKWKEVVESEEKDSKKTSISVARCYPMKNRFPEVMPYDNNRVELHSGRNDYINASFVSDLGSTCPKFIVTQAPMPSTYADFWTMVWEQQAEILVCLLANAELKGHIYWPLEKNQTLNFGPVNVNLHSVKETLYHVESMLNLTHNETKISRVVIHLQYIAWPPGEVPTNPSSFLQFIGDVHNYHGQQRNLQRPIIVHCTGGVGRSGAFCLLSSTIKELGQGHSPPDMSTLAALACQQRRFLLQEREQLKFCYEATLYHAQDILVKRGILSNKSTFDDVLPSAGYRRTHSRHPSEDFILSGSISTKQQANSDNDSSSGVQEQTDPVEPSTDTSEGEQLVQQEEEELINKMTHLVTDEAAAAAAPAESAPKQPSITSILDPANFTLDPIASPGKQRFTKDSFKNPSGLIQPSRNSADPLNLLDPLWSIKKDTK